MTPLGICSRCMRTAPVVGGRCDRCQPPPGRSHRSPSTRAQRDGGEYERNRRIVLRLDRRDVPPPMCHWCRDQVATHADHVTAVSHGGSNRLDNLVPACAGCNLSRKANPNWRPR